MADWLDEIEAQADETSPYYLPRLIAEIRRLRALADTIERLTRERDEARAQAEGWHRCVETICTILGLSPALGADEACRAVQDYQQQAQITAERERDEARALMCGLRLELEAPTRGGGRSIAGADRSTNRAVRGER